MRKLISLKNGELYIQYNGQLYFIVNSVIKKLVHSKFNPDNLAPLDTNCFIQFWNDNKYIIWRNGIKLLESQLSSIILNKKFKIRSLLWCPTGTYLFQDNSLYQIKIVDNKLQCILLFNKLPFSELRSIYYDTESQSYFIGTSTKGLFVIRKSDFHYSDISSSVIPNFYTLVKTSDDKIITSNAILNHKKNKTTHILLNNADCIASYCDASDNVYYEANYMLCRYNLKFKNLIKLFKLDCRLVAIFKYYNTKNILVCTGHRVVLLSDKNLILWEKKIPTKYFVTGLYPFDETTFLLATESGLMWYDLKNNIISKTILRDYRVRTIEIDLHKNIIWIGTDGNGAFLYDNEKIYRLPLGPKKALKLIHSFIDDGKGFLFLPTNNGLFRVNKLQLISYSENKSRDVYFYMFNKKNGLHSNEFNGGGNPSYQKLSDNSTLVLPSIDGLVEFNPIKLNINYPNKPIYIDEILLNGHNNGSIYKNNKIILSPYFKTLAISVSSPFYGNAENLQLEYSLQTNSESEWIPINKNGNILINTLPSGVYKIIIRKAGGIQFKNSVIEIELIVLPMYYSLWWFKVLILIVIFLSTWIIFRYHNRKLLNENRKIDRLVKIRTSELNEAIALLEQSQKSLSQTNILKDQIITMVLHDIRSPVSFLGILNNYIITHFKTMKKDEILNSLKNLNISIRSLKYFMEHFFSWATQQRESFQVHKTTFALQDIFDEVEYLYRELVEFNNNSLLVENSNEICYTDKHILSLIIRNILDNANKNTRNGLIRLYVTKNSKFIEIFIKDNGYGMSQDYAEAFNDLNKCTGNQGIGKIIILNMIQKINGSLDVKSIPNGGSTFIIKLKNEFK